MQLWHSVVIPGKNDGSGRQRHFRVCDLWLNFMQQHEMSPLLCYITDRGKIRMQTVLKAQQLHCLGGFITRIRCLSVIQETIASYAESSRQINTYFFPLDMSLNGAVPPVEGTGNLVLFLHSPLEAFFHSRAVPNHPGLSAQGLPAPHRRQHSETPKQTPRRLRHVPEASRVDTFSLSQDII